MFYLTSASPPTNVKCPDFFPPSKLWAFLPTCLPWGNKSSLACGDFHLSLVVSHTPSLRSPYLPPTHITHLTHTHTIHTSHTHTPYTHHTHISHTTQTSHMSHTHHTHTHHTYTHHTHITHITHISRTTQTSHTSHTHITHTYHTHHTLVSHTHWIAALELCSLKEGAGWQMCSDMHLPLRLMRGILLPWNSSVSPCFSPPLL